MYFEQKQEIHEEIEKLIATFEMLDTQDLPTDICMRQIFKLLHEYIDLCLIEIKQHKDTLG